MVNLNSVMTDIEKGLAAASANVAKLSSPGAFGTAYTALSTEYTNAKGMYAEVQMALNMLLATYPQPADFALRYQMAGESTATLARQFQSQLTRVADLNAQLDTALGQKSGLGIPSWVLYLGGAGIAVAAFLGLRKKR